MTPKKLEKQQRGLGHSQANLTLGRMMGWNESKRALYHSHLPPYKEKYI